MNIKKKLLFLFITFLMSLFLPNYVVAATTFSSLDTQGRLLTFANPVRVSGTGVVTNAKQGDVYKYTNVITVDGVQVNAVVTITELVNMTTLVFDDPAPNPSGGGGRADGNSYTTSFGGVVPEAAIFAPQEWSADKTKEAYATFVISFQDTMGKPLVLKNVYNNSLDMESTEYNAYGGFSSYLVSADNKTNTAKHVIATPSGTNIRFSSSDCTGDNGLYIKDQSRVQAKFATISTLTIKLGQFPNGQVPGNSSCSNKSQRYYGAIFVQDSFIDTPGTQIEVTAPTVNLLTTTNTKPSVTGTIGGTVSTTSPKGSALVTGDTFSVLLNGVTYTAPNANLVISGVSWTLNVPTALTSGQTYEVVATRNGVLVDQTNNELVITPTCVSPQVLNATSTACVTPAATDILWCHSGDGISYSKSVISSTDYSHITHEFDKEAVNGKCPDEVLACVPPQILNAAGTACVTPVTSGTACTPITTPLTNIPADSDYDGNKVTICHFPPGNPTNVEYNTISLSALDTHIAHHGDTIWQSSKNCPATTTSCDTPPTVNSPTTTDKTQASFTGNVGTSTTLTITIAGTSVSNATISPVTKNGTWTYTAPIIAAGTYAVTITGDGGTAMGTLTVTSSVNPTVQAKTTTDKIAVLLEGTSGSSSSLQIQIKNSVGAIQDSGTATIIGSTWSFMMPKALPAGTYSIVAIGDATHGNLTGSGTLTVTSSVSPTVDKKTTTEKVAVPLTGSVGSSTSLTITVKDSTGITKATGTANITGTTWNYTPIVLPAGTYDVTATGDTAHGSLEKTETGALVVSAIAPPTVEAQTTFDTTPVIKGTVGAVALETGEAFAVSVNGKTYTNGVDTNLKVTGTNWELTILVEIPGSATAYPVVATRGSAPDTKTGSGTLTITPCALPKVVNAAGDACITPTPTVVSQILNSNVAVAPVIKGTVGDVVLGSKETFSVTIKTTPPQIYTHATPETELKVTGMNWTLTVPSNKAIVAGTYDVEAARNKDSKNAAPHGELVINLVCLATETAVNGACVAKTFLPTVNSDSTSDTTPTITGTVGTSMLATNETFTVKVDGISFTPTISNADTTWSVAIPVANALSKGAHSVEAIRGDLTGTGTITITECTSPKIVNATTGDCSEPSLRPTVTPSASHNIKEPSIVVAGTWGDIELTAQEFSSKAFSVKVHNSEHSDVKGVLLVSGINWTFTLSNTLSERFAGTFDVDAKRGSKTDLTDGELTITGGSCCINGTTTQCPTTISVPSYTGECNVPVCPATNAAGNCTSQLPDKDKEETFPSQPIGTVPETIKPPADLGYCDDGGKRSYGESMSGITIKRARIANAETIGGTFESNALVGMKVMYGTLTAGSYDDNDNSCEQGYCVNKTITGATLTGAFVDIANDYVDAAGNVIDSSNRGIALTGGVTNPTSFKKDGVTVINATITNGMITAGSDAAGNPVRGSITSGQFADAITHSTSVLTKGRRTQGTLTNATITGATITTATVNGVSLSVVGCDRSLDSTHTPCTVGVITSGTMDSTGVKTFGTVENATLTGATISNTNHCFSSGTVGSKGQLNWKEVVK